MEKANIVTDLGSGSCHVGFAGEDVPRSVFSNLIGRPKRQTPGILIPVTFKELYEVGTVSERPLSRANSYEYRASSEVEFYIGNEAQARREILAMTSPIDRGIVTNWEDMEQLWQYVFTGTLGVSPEEHNVLNSEISFMPKACKEVMLQLLMEKFNVQGYNAQLQGVLAAIAYGHTSSLILECGEGVAQAFPVYESYAFPDTIKSMEIAGKDVTMSLQKLLYEKGYSFTTYSEIEAVREIKERYCSIRPDKMASQSEEEVIYTLPDGQQITIGDERFEAPEVLFRSSLLGYDTGELGGIQDLVHASLQACDSYCRRDLYFNVLLSGGTTLLPGFKERLLQELSSKAPCRVKVWADPARKFMVWIGGSIYASLSFCENKWITRSEYSEHGPNIIHRKCQLAANTKLT